MWVSRRGTGGVADCGTAEEDDPVTWETLAVLGKARRCGGPVPVLRRAARLTGHERPAPDGEHRNRPAPRGRRAKGRPKAFPIRPRKARESDGRIGAMKLGNGSGTRTQRSKGGQC